MSILRLTHTVVCAYLQTYMYLLLMNQLMVHWSINQHINQSINQPFWSGNGKCLKIFFSFFFKWRYCVILFSWMKNKPLKCYRHRHIRYYIFFTIEEDLKYNLVQLWFWRLIQDTGENIYEDMNNIRYISIWPKPSGTLNKLCITTKIFFL